MAREAHGQASVERLAAGLVDGAIQGTFTTELTGWLQASPRFRAFADAYRDKIRKKLRSASEEESLRDVRAELAVAHLLHLDQHVRLAFEAYGSQRGGPDFTVTYRGERPFNLEVTRLRRQPSEVREGGPLLGKLRQLPPSVPNALLMAAPGNDAAALDIAAAVHELRGRADAKDEPFFARRGLESARAFYERFLRLGGVFVWCEEARGEARATAWMNPSARIPLPPRAARACLAALRMER